jgi:hypothetical protein
MGSTPISSFRQMARSVNISRCVRRGREGPEVFSACSAGTCGLVTIVDVVEVQLKGEDRSGLSDRRRFAG